MPYKIIQRTPNNLKKWRRRLNLTQTELAELAHCSRATIIWIERLNHYPTAGVRSRLATALGMSEIVLWPILASDEAIKTRMKEQQHAV